MKEWNRIRKRKCLCRRKKGGRDEIERKRREISNKFNKSLQSIIIYTSRKKSLLKKKNDNNNMILHSLLKKPKWDDDW